MNNKNNFYKNGQIISELQDDILTFYYKDGKIKAQGKCLAGKFEGEWLFYDNSGLVIQIANFKNNEKDGSWKRYDKNGKLIYDAFFEKGKEIK